MAPKIIIIVIVFGAIDSGLILWRSLPPAATPFQRAPLLFQSAKLVKTTPGLRLKLLIMQKKKETAPNSMGLFL